MSKANVYVVIRHVGRSSAQEARHGPMSLKNAKKARKQHKADKHPPAVMHCITGLQRGI